MNIEDYFFNLGWICINEIKKENLVEILDLKIDSSINWEEGYELITNSFDEKIFLNFKIENWEILIGKYFFLDFNTLKKTMNNLSYESKAVKSFAIDMWSNFYCYSESIDGKNIRLWNQNDEGVINEGVLTKDEMMISEDDDVNKILQLADKTTVRFQIIEEYLKKNEVHILK